MTQSARSCKFQRLMRQTLPFVALCVVCVASVPAYAFDRNDVKAFCDNPQLRRSAPGFDFQHRPVDEFYLNLPAGNYKLERDGSLTLFEDGSYVLTLGRGGSLRGTAGDDRLRGKTAIGCSREQLYELTRRNNVSIQTD